MIHISFTYLQVNEDLFAIFDFVWLFWFPKRFTNSKLIEINIVFSWPTIALLVYSSVNVRNVQYTVKLWTLYSLPPGKFTIYSMTTLCHGHWYYMLAYFYLFQILMGATAFMELWIHGVMNAASGYKEYIERLKY